MDSALAHVCIGIKVASLRRRSRSWGKACPRKFKVVGSWEERDEASHLGFNKLLVCRANHRGGVSLGFGCLHERLRE